MRILLATLHVRPSVQAVPLAAGCLKANLAAELRQDCQLLDLFAEQSDDEICRALLARQPHVIAFPLYLWNRTTILRICRQLRQVQPELFLLAGGPEASADSQKVVREGGLDGVICGEGERAFAQLMQQLQGGQKPGPIAGFVPAVDVTDRQPTTATCPDLAALPSPWLQGDLALQPGSGVLWEVARGCHFNCAFCYDAKGHQGVRPVPFERLREELELFVARGVSQIWILDSTFNAPPERGKQLLTLLAEQAPEIHFHLEAKADFLDEETAELLSHISCSVQIGLQAADPAVVMPLQRAFKPEQMERALKQLSAFGVTFGLDLIYGLPNDNHAGFCRSLDFALNQQPNQVDIFPLAVLPGTVLYRQQERFGIRAASEPPYQIQANRSYPDAELERSRQLATATDIFYNRGRAVGFFLQLCDVLGQTPAELLENFADWLAGQTQLCAKRLDSAESWQPADILPLQQAFTARVFQVAGLQKLQPICTDLISYHYLVAETLLTADCRPVERLPTLPEFTMQRWRLNPAVRLQQFHYDLEELETYGGLPLGKIHQQLSPAPNWAIFFRRAEGLICEALQNDFARLLHAAKTGQTGAQLLQQLPAGEGGELVQFAIAEGLLQKASDLSTPSG